MHQSVAHAYYKHHERHLHAFDWNRARQSFETLPNKRAARLRAIPKLIERLPNLVVLDTRVEGQKARAVLHITGLERSKDVDGGSGWYAFHAMYSARDGSVEHIELPIFVTHHLVKRMMQRLSIDDPRAALKNLKSAVGIAIRLREPRDSEVLLVARGGAVIGVRDQRHPKCWTFVTFVDDDKLTPGQLREMIFWGEKAFGEGRA